MKHVKCTQCDKQVRLMDSFTVQIQQEKETVHTLYFCSPCCRERFDEYLKTTFCEVEDLIPKDPKELH